MGWMVITVPGDSRLNVVWSLYCVDLQAANINLTQAATARDAGIFEDGLIQVSSNQSRELDVTISKQATEFNTTSPERW